MEKTGTEKQTEKMRYVIPGEIVARENQGFMAGWGTYTDLGIIFSSVAGVVHTINKLVTVVAQNSPYKPEVGDVIIGRVISVDKKSWRVDINAQRDANLNLTAINLPRGEQRRRSEDDAMQMRTYFEENDLLSGEVQQTHNDGGVNIQTRNLKYGKLKNGILVEVNHKLVKKMKFHFIDLIPDIKAILGINGLIWIYYSTVKLDNEYFTDDQTKINTLNKHETPNEWAAINIILFKNIIKSLENNKILIDQNSIMKYYELYIEQVEKWKFSEMGNNVGSSTKISEGEFLKKKIVITKKVEVELIQKLRSILQSNVKTKQIIDLGKEVDNMRRMIEADVEMEDEEDS